jgi:hypothetical protein
LKYKIVVILETSTPVDNEHLENYVFDCFGQNTFIHDNEELDESSFQEAVTIIEIKEEK